MYHHEQQQQHGLFHFLYNILNFHPRVEFLCSLNIISSGGGSRQLGVFVFVFVFGVFAYFLISLLAALLGGILILGEESCYYDSTDVILTLLIHLEKQPAGVIYLVSIGKGKT